MSLLYTVYIRNFYWWEKNVFPFRLKDKIYLHFCLNEKLSCPGSLQKKTTAGLFLMWNLQVCSGTKFPYKVLALVLFVPMINNKETMMEQQKGVWFIMIRCCWVQINSSTKELTSRQSWQFCCHYCWLKAKPFLRFISAGNPCHRKWHAVSFWFTFIFYQDRESSICLQSTEVTTLNRSAKSDCWPFNWEIGFSSIMPQR